MEAAVDGDGGAGDVAAAGRDEERDVLRAAHVTEGDVPCELAHRLLGLRSDDFAPGLVAEPSHCFGERGRPPRRRDDPRPFLGKGAGDRVADSLARPVDSGPRARGPR